MTPAEAFQHLTTDHISAAVRDFEGEKVLHEFHDSERYDLIFEGRRLPPKAIVGIAVREVIGHVLRPRDFSGGIGSSCFRALERLRFEILPKAGGNLEKYGTFTPGEIYRRREIHTTYGGQMRGGISTPAECPFIFLFSGDQGDQFGYRDEFRDGIYHYTGEGQVGDMQMTRGNAAIINARAAGKRLLLFEVPRKGYAQFFGEMECVGYHTEIREDRNGDERKAFVFELDVISNVHGEVHEPADESTPPGSIRGKNLKELKKLALLSGSANAPAKVRKQLARCRSGAVRAYVLKRANGVCEGCGNPAPFLTSAKQPYLEPHHTTRLADGGPDHPCHVIALCPTCHRRAHHAADAEAFNEGLKAKLLILDPPE